MSRYIEFTRLGRIEETDECILNKYSYDPNVDPCKRCMLVNPFTYIIRPTAPDMFSMEHTVGKSGHKLDLLIMLEKILTKLPEHQGFDNLSVVNFFCNRLVRSASLTRYVVYDWLGLLMADVKHFCFYGDEPTKYYSAIANETKNYLSLLDQRNIKK